MNITEEHKKKAMDVKIMLSRLEPEVIYCLADFMDFEGQSDEGMHSQCVYEAAECSDIYTEDGKPQEFILDMGMSLPSIKVQFTFQDIGGACYEIKTAKILERV